jgi:photosystem II stability/assembly factor-like uncharacterized protein
MIELKNNEEKSVKRFTVKQYCELLNEIYFADSLNGIIATGMTDGAIYKTSDGSFNWKNVTEEFANEV